MPIQCSRPKNLRIGFTFLLLSLIMRAYLLPRPFCAVPAEAPAFAGIPSCIFPLHLPRRGVAHTVCAAALPELSAPRRFRPFGRTSPVKWRSHT